MLYNVGIDYPSAIDDRDQARNSHPAIVGQVRLGKNRDMAIGHAMASKTLARTHTAALPSSRCRGFRQTQREARVVPQCRHAHRKRVNTAHRSKLVDKTFGEKRGQPMRPPAPVARGHADVGRVMVNCVAGKSIRWHCSCDGGRRTFPISPAHRRVGVLAFPDARFEFGLRRGHGDLGQPPFDLSSRTDLPRHPCCRRRAEPVLPHILCPAPDQLDRAFQPVGKHRDLSRNLDLEPPSERSADHHWMHRHGILAHTNRPCRRSARESRHLRSDPQLHPPALDMRRRGHRLDCSMGGKANPVFGSNDSLAPKRGTDIAKTGNACAFVKREIKRALDAAITRQPSSRNELRSHRVDGAVRGPPVRRNGCNPALGFDHRQHAEYLVRVGFIDRFQPGIA